jgi:hypothetical protein
MPSATKAQLHAAILVGAISTPPVRPEVLELSVPAIHRTVRRQLRSLDLNAPRFRYSVSNSGVQVVREGARVHGSKCGNLHRRSPARA